MMPATASFRGDLESKLPLDLIHCILEYSGKHTLCSTSLVCKSWLQISQPSLFEGVNIGDFERLLERYTQTREILFRDSYPNAESIKHFSFDFERSFFVMETEKMSANMLSLVDQLKGKVPAAIKLSIFYQHADHFFSSLQKYVQLDQPFSPQLIPSICTTFCNITKLEIQLVKETIQNVLRFICSFPRLEVADIDCGEIVSLQSSSSNVIECTLSETLRNFSWRASTFNGSFSLETPVNNLEWLSYHPPRPHIFHLSLHVVFVLALNSFSSLCFTTLKSLYLSAHVKSYQLSYSGKSIIQPRDLSIVCAI
ncbi:hypothetical protein L218DRAFT_710251 [Marasmius fiardii PR-910]|nr:hypothetical protein L218DRAFT_710251 [Marasmius fiardii PR-910]